MNKESTAGIELVDFDQLIAKIKRSGDYVTLYATTGKIIKKVPNTPGKILKIRQAIIKQGKQLHSILNPQQDFLDAIYVELLKRWDLYEHYIKYAKGINSKDFHGIDAEILKKNKLNPEMMNDFDISLEELQKKVAIYKGYHQKQQIITEKKPEINQYEAMDRTVIPTPCDIINNIWFDETKCYVTNLLGNHRIVIDKDTDNNHFYNKCRGLYNLIIRQIDQFYVAVVQNQVDLQQCSPMIRKYAKRAEQFLDNFKILEERAYLYQHMKMPVNLFEEHPDIILLDDGEIYNYDLLISLDRIWPLKHFITDLKLEKQLDYRGRRTLVASYFAQEDTIYKYDETKIRYIMQLYYNQCCKVANYLYQSGKAYSNKDIYSRLFFVQAYNAAQNYQYLIDEKGIINLEEIELINHLNRDFLKTAVTRVKKRRK